MNTIKSVEAYENLSLPSGWFQYAEELHDSSEILYNNKDQALIEHIDASGANVITKSNVSRTYLLLIGFSMENVLKAKVIADSPQLVKGGKIAPEISKDHNLIALQRRITNFRFSGKEDELLKLLSDAIPYWGRYPIPKRWEMLKKETIATPEIRTTYIDLYHRLRKHVYLETRFGTDGPNGTKIGEWFMTEYEDHISVEEHQAAEDVYAYRREKLKKIEEQCAQHHLHAPTN